MGQYFFPLILKDGAAVNAEATVVAAEAVYLAARMAVDVNAAAAAAADGNAATKEDVDRAADSAAGIAAAVFGAGEVETYLYSHDYGNGLKMYEHAYMGNELVSAFESLICPEGKYWKSRVVWQGDGRKFSYDLEKVNQLRRMNSTLDMSEYNYIVNHSKRQYVEKIAINQDNNHPLPLLICEGYYDDEIKVKGELKIGAWARDIISIEKDAPEEFEEKLFNRVKTLAGASFELCNDYDIVLDVVKRNGLELEYVEDELIDCEEIILAAVKQNGLALEFASDNLRENCDIVLAAVLQNPSALESVIFGEYDEDNFKTVLCAIKKDGMLLEIVKENISELCDDVRIVLAAVKQNGLALEFASDDMRDDEHVVKAAIENNPLALEFILGERLFDPIFWLPIVEKDGMLLKFVDGLAIAGDNDDVTGYFRIVYAAIKQNKDAIKFVNFDYIQLDDAKKIKSMSGSDCKRKCENHDENTQYKNIQSKKLKV